MVIFLNYDCMQDFYQPKPIVTKKEGYFTFTQMHSYMI